MRPTTPQQTGRARGAQLCSEAALLRGASNPFSHYPNPRVLVQSLGRCLSSSSGGSVRPLLQHGPRSEKPSERWIISHRPPALSVPPVLSLCLTLLVPHCLVEHGHPAHRPHQTFSSSGRELSRCGTLAPEESPKHPGCPFIIRRRMTDGASVPDLAVCGEGGQTMTQ